MSRVLLSAFAIAFCLLASHPAYSQYCANCNGGAYFLHFAAFGNRGAICAGYQIQTQLDLMAPGNTSARWAYGDCANGARPAGNVGIAAATGFLTGLSGVNDFMLVANDTCRHLRLANNSSFENSGNICFDLTPTAGTQVNRMTLFPDGKIDFNIGNWNCQTGKIRFQGESWDGSSGNVEDPVMKLYRPTGTSSTCPDPLSYTWWIQNAGSSGGDNSGSLQFRALPTSGAIGSETVSTMQTLVTMQRNGNVGINTLTPVAKLQVKDGAILFDGTTGSTPISGAGTRMMWVPAKSAFRAGLAGTTTWDDANIGNYSWAGGQQTLASGASSISFGQSNEVYGDCSASFGRSNVVQATGKYSMCIGWTNQVDGFYSLCGGLESRSRSPGDICFGLNCKTGSATNEDSHVNIALGDLCEAIGKDCLALGWNNNSAGQSGLAMGSYCEVTKDFSVAMGTYLSNTASNALVFGSGIDATNRLANSQPNTIKLGTNTQQATLVVTPKIPGTDGTGDCGNVGIGFDDPLNRFEVKGGAVIGNSYAGTITRAFADNKLYVEGNVTIASVASNNYQLYVAGTTYCTSGLWTACDSSLKRDIEPYAAGLESIRKINTISFKFKPEVNPDSNRTYLGVIAQDLAKVIPTAVRLDTLRYEKVVSQRTARIDTLIDPIDSTHHHLKYTYSPLQIDTSYETRYSVNPTDVLYTVVNGVKELDKILGSSLDSIESLRRTILQQDSTIVFLKTEGQRMLTTLQDLMSRIQSGSGGFDSYESTVLLDQNRPNPFNGTTEIVYWVDSSVDGDVLLEITQLSTTRSMLLQPATKGLAVSQRVDATGWEKGVYLYCLRTSDRVFACKKMLITN